MTQAPRIVPVYASCIMCHHPEDVARNLSMSLLFDPFSASLPPKSSLANAITSSDEQMCVFEGLRARIISMVLGLSVLALEDLAAGPE